MCRGQGGGAGKVQCSWSEGIQGEKLGCQVERSLDVGALNAFSVRLRAWALFLRQWQPLQVLQLGDGMVRFVFQAHSASQTVMCTQITWDLIKNAGAGPVGLG